MKKTIKGSCLCRSVLYEVSGSIRDVMLCHCNQCRKTSGHYVAATSCPTDNLTVTDDKTLNWYQSSSTAKRAFCSVCGCQLFWRSEDSGRTSIFAGTIDGDTGLKVSNQLYPEHKGDYYEIPDVEVIAQESFRK